MDAREFSKEILLGSFSLRKSLERFVRERNRWQENRSGRVKKKAVSRVIQGGESGRGLEREKRTGERVVEKKRSQR